jgi:hypothetical protein
MGKLIRMNAEDLIFEPETFDLIISLSTFEHFFNGVNFQPVWTASYGHHLHHIPSVAKLIPPWAHLIWTEETMRQAFRERWPADAAMSLEEAIEWIYRSSEINRVDIVTLRNMFRTCDFEVEWMTPLFDDKSDNKPVVADYLSRILPYSADDLMTLGFSILLKKR